MLKFNILMPMSLFALLLANDSKIELSTKLSSLYLLCINSSKICCEICISSTAIQLGQQSATIFKNYMSLSQYFNCSINDCLTSSAIYVSVIIMSSQHVMLVFMLQRPYGNLLSIFCCLSDRYILTNSIQFQISLLKTKACQAMKSCQKLIQQQLVRFSNDGLQSGSTSSSSLNIPCLAAVTYYGLSLLCSAQKLKLLQVIKPLKLNLDIGQSQNLFQQIQSLQAFKLSFKPKISSIKQTLTKILKCQCRDGVSCLTIILCDLTHHFILFYRITVAFHKHIQQIIGKSINFTHSQGKVIICTSWQRSTYLTDLL